MKKLDNVKTTFELDDTIYTETKKGYFYKTTGGTDKKGQPLNMRIPKHVFEMAFEEYLQTAQDNADADEWQAQADAEIEARKAKNEKADRETEKAMNKTKRTRRPKDIAFEYKKDGEIILTLTTKQVDFIKHIPDTCFYENGLESTPWCDVLADEIGGQFAGKPMTVGAMISTLREKHLIYTGISDVNGRKAKYFGFTELGMEVANELGLE